MVSDQKSIRTNPSSRRAILFFSDNTHDRFCDIDFPCVVSLQFLLRNGRLDAITFARSSDLYYGFCYDVFFSSLLQEIMAIEINADIGSYFHMGSSLHLYEKDVSKTQKTKCTETPSTMSPIDSIRDIEEFVRAEKKYRERHQEPSNNIQSEFWSSAFSVLKYEIDKKHIQSERSARADKAI